MKHIIILAFLFAQISLGFTQTINTQKSKITFEVSMGLGSVDGTMQNMAGTISFDSTKLEQAQFNVCIQPATINTDNKKRDKHLQSEDFLEVETFSTTCFQSSKVIKTETGYKAIGKLTLHGVTREVELPFTFSNNRFEGTLKINRLDYGIGPKGTFFVGDEVEVKVVCVVK